MSCSHGTQPALPCVADAQLELRDVSTEFRLGGTSATIVKQLNLSVRKGTSLALVGESGSGKSVTALSIMRLLGRDARISGEIFYRMASGEVIDLLKLDERAITRMRGREISMIFQDPMRSLNPVLTIGNQIGEKIVRHNTVSRAEGRNRTIELLRSVEIPAPERRVDEYPHQLSGGMRQRVMIAMALACDPSLLIADEPTTALDVTIQSQILDLLRKAQDERGMSMIFISHNLGVVAEIAQNVAVMYAGRIVELAEAVEMYRAARHPYTEALMNCVPSIQKLRSGHGSVFELKPIPGTLPSVFDSSAGCQFAQRCSYVTGRCGAETPPLLQSGRARKSRCWEWQALASDGAIT